MLETLRFVKGAVAKKDLVPALTHFRIHDGRISGYNGRMAISSPIQLNIDATPQADAFIRAIAACSDEETALQLLANGKLRITSGAFRAMVPCTTEVFPDVVPDGERIELPEEPGLLPILRELLPFTAEDASRPWAQGILLCGESAFATNNVAAVQRWLGYTFPRPVNVPKTTIAELLRIGEEPVAISVSHNSATFHYADERWVWTTLYSLEWPDILALLDRARQGGSGRAVDLAASSLPDVLAKLAPFIGKDRRIVFDGALARTPDDASVEAEHVLDMELQGCYNIDQLLLVLSVAQYIDLNCHPAPSLFYGDTVRGAVIGMRA